MIDILISHPKHIDYLWFRANFHWIRKYVKKVVISFTQGLEPDISGFLMGTHEYKGVDFITAPVSNGADDWRNLSVRDMIINHSTSPYVLFLEQDFLMKERFLSSVISYLGLYDWIYFKDGDRIHPAFSLIKREYMMKTSLNFGVSPAWDHFGMFHNELQEMKLREADLKKLEFDNRDFFHMAGFTNNYHCFREGQPLYKPNEFLSYNHYARELPMLKDAGFDELCQLIEKGIGMGFDPYGTIRQFFLYEDLDNESDLIINPASYRVQQIKKQNEERLVV